MKNSELVSPLGFDYFIFSIKAHSWLIIACQTKDKNQLKDSVQVAAEAAKELLRSIKCLTVRKNRQNIGMGSML